MKFRKGDIVKSNREGTIGFETVQKIVGVKGSGRDKVYVLERQDNERTMVLKVKFVDEGYDLYE